MTDEENEAIIDFEREVEDGRLLKSDIVLSLDTGLIIKNLLKKQQKEIEHQKEKRENQKKELAILNAKQVEFNKLVNTVNSYKGQFKRQQKEIEELKDTNKFYNTAYNLGKTYSNKRWEEKIKAKIEYYKKIDNAVGVRILESLLEKEYI